ncbi:MAG TPA: hypothetical protein DCR43_03615 [Bacteroidales bacterium]|nr:MAG: hypothetical protein A2X11_12740 [Bacteroidetes bacterium GWE2_42_24]OFY28224.1 MAG: hypothetical protein A2X09_13525 [Bacteroidetes bacterium GWF2_43_11]HAQ64931.1 hypothetical protein [Bacteroidales bacterium]HBZ65672.1 hypothetical protein [Bacteroidales bacterium]
MRHGVLIILLFLFSFSSLRGQSYLSPDEAVAIGLENNFSVKISRNTLQIAHNNNTAGSAGYLPTVTTSGSYNENLNSSRQQYYDGRLREATNSKSNSFTAGVALNWTLFDGFGMFVEDQRLDELELSGEAELRDQMEAVVSEIITTYYSLVQQDRRLKVLYDALQFGHNRKALARQKFDLGISSELDYLQAVADLNADSADYLRQQADLLRTKVALNNLLVRGATVTFTTVDSIGLLPDLTYEELSNPLIDQNATIELAKRRQKIAIYETRLARSVTYPQLNFTAGYSFTKSTSAIGLVESNRNYGPNAGVNLSYTLFDGFRNRQRIRNARLSEQNAAIALDETLQAIQSTLYTLYSDYRAQQQLVALEKSNVTVVRNNTRIALDKYRLGELNDLDLRQIQLRQIEVENSLLQSFYQVKVLETELLRLSGRIIR